VIKQIRPEEVTFNMDWMSHGTEKCFWVVNSKGGWSYVYDSRKNFYRVVSEMLERIAKLDNADVDAITKEYDLSFVKKNGLNNFCITDAEEVKEAADIAAKEEKTSVKKVTKKKK
jgi:hypothetical protein